MTIIRRALTLALSAVALALAAGTVVAADVIAISKIPDPANSDIAMNAQGRNVAVFEAPVDKGFAVFARSRLRAGGPWGTRVRLSTIFDERPDDIRVAVDERGRAIVTWRRPGGPASASDLGYAIRLTAAGPWELHARSGIARGVDASSVLAFSGGRATLAWGELSAAGWRVRRATLDLAAGTPRSWAVEAPRALGAPALAVNPRGDVAAIGLATDPTTGIVVATRARLTEGWGPPEALAGSGFAPVVAAALSGAAVVAYGVNLDTLDPPDPDLVFPPSDLTYPLGNIMRARRRAPTGVWGAEETVFAFYDGMRETYREARNVRAAVDAFGTTLLAWSSTDSGLGAPWATAAPAAAPFPEATKYATVDGIGQIALAPSGRGEAAVMWADDSVFSRTLRSDRVPTGSCATPPESPPSATPDVITLSAVQLRINQRIYAAALRRADALDGWLRARIATRDLCGGGIGASSLGAGIEIGPALGPPAAPAPAPTPRALAIRPAADKAGVVFALTVEQLQINQRIASAALRRANALGARLDAGLSGGDIRLGAVSADRIGATIGAVRVGSVAPPAPTRTVIAPATDKTGVVFTLSAAQLRINQRIGQAAIRRLNEVRGRLLDGISGDELRRATVTGANLTP